MNEMIDGALPLLTILAQIIIVVTLLALIVSKATKKSNVIVDLMADNAILISFVAALAATLGSLFYSEIMGYDPCKLCWFQRIVMYPQVITLGLALKGKQSIILTQSIIFSIIGAVIALYHYLGQIAVVSSLPCDAIGYSSSCSKFFVLDYGYITIPMMALSAFGLILVATITKKLAQ